MTPTIFIGLLAAMAAIGVLSVLVQDAWKGATAPVLTPGQDYLIRTPEDDFGASWEGEGWLVLRISTANAVGSANSSGELLSWFPDATSVEEVH